jgi:hypothetical protein
VSRHHDHQLTAAEAYEMAPNLVIELSRRVGDAAGVLGVLREWIDIEGFADASLVAMAALVVVFADCLTEVPTEQLPAGAQVLRPPAASSTIEESA